MKKNQIYVNNDEIFLESRNLNKDSEYKIIDREECLVVQVKKVKNSKLYIKIIILK